MKTKIGIAVMICWSGGLMLLSSGLVLPLIKGDNFNPAEVTSRNGAPGQMDQWLRDRTEVLPPANRLVIIGDNHYLYHWDSECPLLLSNGHRRMLLLTRRQAEADAASPCGFCIDRALGNQCSDIKANP